MEHVFSCSKIEQERTGKIKLGNYKNNKIHSNENHDLQSNFYFHAGQNVQSIAS